MTAKVHPLDNPPPYHANLPTETKADRELLNARGLLQNFFVGVALECANRGFCVVNANLIQGLFCNAGETPTVPRLRELSLRYGLTAVLDRANKRAVFRVFHLPDNAHAETMIRVQAEVTCDVCGFTMREHPEDALFAWLRVRCDGRRVKL